MLRTSWRPPAALVLTLSLALSLATPASAHHGFGTFDLTQEVTYEGVITRVDLINPHSWLYFDVTNADGTLVPHRCEMRSAHVLRRSGWSEEVLPIGARVVIEAAPDREDAQSCYLETIRFDDGSHMDRYGQYVQGDGGDLVAVDGPVVEVTELPRRAFRRPNGSPNLAGDWAAEQVVMVDARGAGGGLVPLSEVGELREAAESQSGAGPGGGGRGFGRGRGNGGPRLYGGTALTARGEREAAAFQRSDNPRFSCETTSILFDWTFDGPVNRIIQRSDSFVIYYGQMNLRREVHLNLRDHPADVEPTRAGHSIGWWEADTLVVDTTNFLPGVLNAPVRHSDQLHVVERFTLDPETVALTRSYVATDPIYLQGEYSGADTIHPADAAYAPDDCQDLGFVDFEEAQELRPEP